MRSHDGSDGVPAADARPADEPWGTMLWPPPEGIRLLGRVVDLAQVDPEQDVDELFEALNHDVVWQHVPGRPTTPDAYAATLTRHVARGRLPWVVRLRTPCAGLSAGTVVGASTYLDVSVADVRLEIGSTAYCPAAWGTAVNPDTKLVLLAYAFETLGVGRVQLKTDVRNVRSQRAIARLGARYEGTLRRYQRRADGTVRDTAMFSVTAEDWPRVRDGLHERLDAIEATAAPLR